MNRFIRILLPVLCLSIAFRGAAQEKGIHFFKGSWEALLDSAKKNDRLIFVDVYTVWCGPCKKMDKEVFSLETVGDAYRDFINYKLDAEKGEGPAIARRYNVNAYPTFLFLNPAGELIHRGQGGIPVEQFMALGLKAKEQRAEPVTLSMLEADYAAGNRDAAFLQRYIARLTKLGLDATKPLDEYFAGLLPVERLRGQTLRFFYEHCSNALSPVFSLLLQQKDSLEHLGIEPADYALQLGNMLYAGLYRSMANEALDTTARLLELCNELPSADAFFQKDYKMFRIEYLGKRRQTDSMLLLIHKLVAAAAAEPVASIRQRNEAVFRKFYEPYLTGKADSTSHMFDALKRGAMNKVLATAASDLHFGAKMIEKYCGDKAMLAKALAWNEKARELLPEYFQFTAVTAGLQYRLGRKKEAVRTMKWLVAKKVEGKEGAGQAYDKILAKMEARSY